MISFLYDLLLFLPLSLAVQSFLVPYFLPEQYGLWWIMLTILSVLLYALVKHLKIRGRSILLGGFAAVLCAVLLILPAKERLPFFYENRFLFYVFFLGLLCCIAGDLMNRYRKVRILIAAAGIVLLFVKLFTKDTLSALSVLTVLLYGILVLTDEIERRQKKEGDTEPKKHLLAVSPFLLAVFLVCSLVKMPEKPYDWAFVKNLVRSIQSTLIRLSETLFPDSGWDSEDPVIGFSDRGSFGGNLKNAEHTVMDLTGFSGNDTCLYLSGKVFDSFDGSGWEKTDYDPVFERELDTLETWCAAEGSSDLLRKAGFVMKYKDMATKSLFIPSKVLPPADIGELAMEGADLTYPDQKSAEEAVKIMYLRLNRDNEAFSDFLNQEHTITKEEWEEAKTDLGLARAEGCSYSDYERYRSRLKEVYGTKVSLSPELKKLMDQTLASADTDYEKLERIGELFSEFTYTDRPGPLPSDLHSPSDYLDYFMLEKKEGYCSYFATAFVLLARSEGIPARYVQGYRVPVERMLHKEVSSTMAHAWAEAYLPGTGWYVFEVTPGYRSVSSWMTAEDQTRKTEPAEKNAPEESTEALPEEQEETVPSTQLTLTWQKILIPVLTGLFFILLVFAFDRLIRKLRYDRKDEREKCAWLCKRCLFLLKRRGFARKESETLTEFEERVKPDVSDGVLSFCGLYEEMLYGGKAAGKEERLLLEENVVRIRHIRRSHRKKEKQKNQGIA